MSDVTPQTKQQSVVTTALSWLILAYIAGVGCVCVCAHASDASVDDTADVTLSANASVDDTMHVDARLLPALATVEKIASLAYLEPLVLTGEDDTHVSKQSPIPRLRYAPKTSPPAMS